MPQETGGKSCEIGKATPRLHRRHLTGAQFQVPSICIIHELLHAGDAHSTEAVPGCMHQRHLKTS